MKEYFAKFRQGEGPMAMSAIDFYKEDNQIIKHEWAMGGETKTKVKSVPDNIHGYTKL